MPRGDGTGPDGLGPMTGRGAGYCAGYDRPGYMNPAVGGRGLARGFRGGRGRGRGRGFRARRFARPAAPAARPAASAQYADSETARKQEVNNLEQEKEMLKEELTAIENRIAELKQQQEDNE